MATGPNFIQLITQTADSVSAGACARVPINSSGMVRVRERALEAVSFTQCATLGTIGKPSIDSSVGAYLTMYGLHPET